jgi:nitrate reductase gamma subunit
MNFWFALLAIAVLILLAIVGASVPGLHFLFGIVAPYAAIAVFMVGIIYRITRWAKSPVPFHIVTTTGQQKSLPWIKSNKLDCPSTTLGVIGRMALEILLFRSLFRNTKAEFKNGPRILYGGNKWLWLGGLAFHWSFLIIFLRHYRFFAEPIPFFVTWLEGLDGFMQIGVPVLYITDIIILAAITYLFLRRVFSPQIRYISLLSDYFPLLLIGSIAATGVLMRYFFKTDIVAVKELAMRLMSFQPMVPEGLGVLFYIHLFLVSVLFAYFPFSKLMHLGGIFLSPTRNLANNSRMKRHVNPWDYPVKVHTYAEWEDEFREKMIAAGLPVEKED